MSGGKRSTTQVYSLSVIRNSKKFIMIRKTLYLLEIGLYIRLERYTNGIGLMRSCYYHCPTEAANILSSTCLPYTRDRESGIEDSA
jgi:hypothetical protein